ncbi:MAG: winged helix-turn-helix domain-containing protein [Acidimicrobiia bacterium]
MLEWPHRQQDREDLKRRGVPRLLLIAPTTAPPECSDCLEDWVRLPADEADLDARLLALVTRRPSHTIPTLDEHGVLRRDSEVAFLSPFERKLAEILIDNLGDVVPTTTIERKLDYQPDTRCLSLRVHLSRLRKSIAPFGLCISCVRAVGYTMHQDIGIAAPPQHANKSARSRLGGP